VGLGDHFTSFALCPLLVRRFTLGAAGLRGRVDSMAPRNLEIHRRNDLDGRGNLSEEALVKVTRFFLDICLDQIDFMESLMRPSELRARIMTWADDEIRTKRLHDSRRDWVVQKPAFAVNDSGKRCAACADRRQDGLDCGTYRRSTLRLSRPAARDA
jgi:hypothetical protein